MSSIYHIESTKMITMNGIKYNTELNTDLDIDFSASSYKINIKEDTYGTSFELTPDNMDILHEVTNIFPLSDYEIRFTQGIYKHTEPHVSLYLNIRNRSTGEKVHIAEGAILSDADYAYIRDIFTKDFPQYKWQTAEEYICSEIVNYMRDSSGYSLLTEDAWSLLGRLISARYKEVKTAGYVDFDCDLADDMTRSIIEDALRACCRSL